MQCILFDVRLFDEGHVVFPILRIGTVCQHHTISLRSIPDYIHVATTELKPRASLDAQRYRPSWPSKVCDSTSRTRASIISAHLSITIHTCSVSIACSFVLWREHLWSRGGFSASYMSVFAKKCRLRLCARLVVIGQGGDYTSPIWFPDVQREVSGS